jgi:hypothetical protein
MNFNKSLLLILLAELLVAALGISFYGLNIEGLQATTRFSGRLSLVIFSFIFILLPYHRNKLTGLLSDKFFLVFAVAHGIHLVELLSYIHFSGGTFIPTRAAGGALAYALIFVMPLIDTRVTGKKKVMFENIYLFYVWLVFFMTYLPRIQGNMQVGGSFSEFITLFVGVCMLLAIRIVLTLTSRKTHD